MREAAEHLHAVRMLHELSGHFGVPAPMVRWNPSAVRGQTHWRCPRIVEVGPAMAFGLEPTILHEFGHLLAEQREPGHLDHGVTFALALREVVAYWGKFYPWDQEFPSVRDALQGQFSLPE
jgi:hypothetical protein